MFTPLMGYFRKLPTPYIALLPASPATHCHTPNSTYCVQQTFVPEIYLTKSRTTRTGQNGKSREFSEYMLSFLFPTELLAHLQT